MHEILLQYILFAAKTVTLLALLGAFVFAMSAGLRAARGGFAGERFEIEHINERLQRISEILQNSIISAPLSRRQRRQLRKQRRAQMTAFTKVGRVFVLDFEGDIGASQVEALREEITALLQIARNDDEIVLRLESAGGTVHGYGLAASQLQRLRAHGLKLTIAVDKIAASGGYMMASVAERIVAAPFAIIGSIGVVAQLPNVHRLLKRHDIDYELHTAGEYKRTLTVFGENTDAARAKFREELDEAHGLFKSFLADNRPQLELPRVATGEHWFGRQALELQLVDELRTSDDYLLERARDHNVFQVRYRPEMNLTQKLSSGLMRWRARRTQQLRLPGLA